MQRELQKKVILIQKFLAQFGHINKIKFIHQKIIFYTFKRSVWLIKEKIYNYKIKNPSDTDNLVNAFESGSIAMVKRGKNNSSSTEFFFVTNKIPALDGRYSIFGKIIKGLDVLNNIDKEDYIKKVQIYN